MRGNINGELTSAVVMVHGAGITEDVASACLGPVFGGRIYGRKRVLMEECAGEKNRKTRDDNWRICVELQSEWSCHFLKWE